MKNSEFIKELESLGYKPYGLYIKEPFNYYIETTGNIVQFHDRTSSNSLDWLFLYTNGKLYYKTEEGYHIVEQGLTLESAILLYGDM